MTYENFAVFVSICVLLSEQLVVLLFLFGGQILHNYFLRFFLISSFTVHRHLIMGNSQARDGLGLSLETSGSVRFLERDLFSNGCIFGDQNKVLSVFENKKNGNLDTYRNGEEFTAGGLHRKRDFWLKLGLTDFIRDGILYGFPIWLKHGGDTISFEL